MSELNKLSASEAGAKIASGEITCSALIRDCLERISKREEDVQAWQYLDPEAALHQARQLDQELASGHRRGPLHGVPLGVKDIFDTYDMPTEYGCRIYKGNQPMSDAGTVARARHVGMVIMGKTVTTELATHVPARTRNPHMLSHTPGGSSSGSAAAVADFMIPLAIGTQTVGSTIRPAAFCGVVGYKPTFNLLSRAGCKVEADSLDTVGMFGRSVTDVALYAGEQINDQRLTQLPKLHRPLCVGICRTFDFDLAKPETVAALERARSVLTVSGALVSDFALPESFRPLRDAHWLTYLFEQWRAYGDEYYRAPEGLDPTLVARIEEGGRITGEQYEKAQATGRQCRAMFADAMGGCDVLIAPSAAGEAPEGYTNTGPPVFNQIWSYMWTPTVTVPAHLGPNGLPVGIQVCGRIGDDPLTLSAAHWIHQRLSA